jgi:hypothetical protein
MRKFIFFSFYYVFDSCVVGCFPELHRRCDVVAECWEVTVLPQYLLSCYHATQLRRNRCRFVKAMKSRWNRCALLTSNAFLLRFVVFDSWENKQYHIQRSWYAEPISCCIWNFRWPRSFVMFYFFEWYEKIMATQICCNMKSAWHIIIVEVYI